MAVTIDGAGPLAGATTLNGLTIPTTGFGKVLQVVRATDTTDRSTTSTSFVDVTGMSVTITPQKSTSAVLILSTFSAVILDTASNLVLSNFQITDSSNNPISGAQALPFGSLRFTVTANPRLWVPLCFVGYATPATTSATTYKLRFNSQNASITTSLQNNTNAGQMFAIEVSA